MQPAALLDSNVQEGFLDVPAGFLLGCLVGLFAFGAFRLLNLVRSLI